MSSRDTTLTKNNRRQFLKLAGYGTLGVMAGGFGPLLDQSEATQKSPKGFIPDLDLSLVAQPGEVSIFPGKPTKVWQYHTIVHSGDNNRVSEIPDSYLGPIIKVHQGEKVRIRYKNQIPEDSIVHWHGLHVPATMDGHPRYVIPQGHTYLYEFEVKNRAGTYWYHPHPHGKTGPQVYRGLAGLFVVSDKEEQALGLPDAEYDIPLVLQDRTFDRNNQLVYTTGHRMEQMTGFIGDWIMVNGMPDFTLPVSTGAYRLRLLNGSNSRIYKLAWQDGRPLTIIGTDGGLLDKPVYRNYAFLSPGERLEIWADFSDKTIGSETSLVSLPFEAGTMGRGRMGRGMMMGGRMGQNSRLPNGADFIVFKVKVTKQGTKKHKLPEKLSEIEYLKPSEAVNYYSPKQFYLTMQHMQWSINGRVFQMEDVADDEIVQLDSKEIWEFHNTGGGMMRMMDMPHPIHLHGKQFRVIERMGVSHSGYVDDGWKDTVLLMPGERIKILVDFADHLGLFLYHCHNLEHEDMGMMRNYFVSGNIKL
jgi:FtsP/CotA-like multicopper oxidase with cupredoxin domain